MADVDEALVEEVAQAWSKAPLCEHCMEDPARMDGCETCTNTGARAVLAHLAATGRLVGEGEQRVEWGASRPGTEYSDPRVYVYPDEQSARLSSNLTASGLGRPVRRTVHTWTTPDGATGTLVGPWVEVEG